MEEDGVLGMAQNVSSVDDGRLVSVELFRIIRFTNYTFILPALNIFGIITNIINIIVFLKIGFKETVNMSLFALAISDLCSNIPIIWFEVAQCPWLEELDLNFNQFTVIYHTGGWPHFACVRLTGVITAFVTLERCLCVILPLKIKSIITHRRVFIFLVTASVLTISCFIPVYATHKNDWVYYPEWNKTLIGLVITQQRLLFEVIYFPFIGVIFPALTFLLVTIFTILLVSSLKKKSKWRQSATGVAKGSEISSKEQKAATLVITLSTLFIVCFFPVITAMTSMVVDSEFSILGIRYRAFLVTWAFFLIPECFNSSVNIFIYYYKSKSYRDTFNKMFRRNVAET